VSAWAGRVWALARLTLLEAVRRKIFLILIFFAAALVSATLFFPSVDAEGRLRLTQAWSLRAIGFFTAVVALFLAGFSLPSDFEQRRIYVLVSKPVSRPAVFLGRWLGYALLLALFIGLLALISTLFMRAVGLFGGKDSPPLAARPRLGASAFLHRNGAPLTERGEDLVAVAANGGLAWRFEGLSRGDFDAAVRVSVRLMIGSPEDRYRSDGRIRIFARGLDGGQALPDQTWNTNEEREFDLPRQLVGQDGRLEILLEPGDPDGYIAASAGRLVLYGKSDLFELAYLQGMGLVLLQSLVVLSMTLAASTFCSAPLSILLGILIFFVGVVHGAVAEGVRDIDASLKVQEETGRAVGVGQDINPALARFSRIVSRPVLAVIPDFSHFDYSQWLLKDLTVSWKDLGRATGQAFPPVLALTALGLLVMRFKGFAG
jgi:ABC-type transport system involved in multi-copper enzyme maturation permease subunit